MKITKDTCIALHEELERVIPDIEKKLGIAIKVGSTRYSAADINLTLECTAVEDDVDVADKDAVAEAEFKAYAKVFGGEPDWFGKTYKDGSVEYKVVGIKRNARSNAFIVRNIRKNKDYVTCAAVLRIYLSPETITFTETTL